jgi:predicted ATPase
VQAAALRSWAEAPAVLRQGWMPWVAGVLAVGAVSGIVVWLKGISLSPLLLVLLVEAGVRRPFSKRIAEVLEGADRALEQMKLLSGLLEVMEAEGFEAGRLREIEGRLRGSAVKGSVAIAQLGRLGQYRDSMDNWFVKLLNLPLMYSVQLAWVMERWRGRHGRAVGAWLEAVAEMEALVSLATYSYEHPGDVFPEFVEERGWFEAEELGHPLIAAAKCVRNSLRMGGEVRVLVISGSNMSGKSTLMRTVGVNTVLAMCGAPVRAGRLRLSALRMGASLLVNDSLQSGQSRFYAEIERLRRVCSCAESYAGSCADGESERGESKSGGGGSVMFLLDELLQGTNSKDRLVGARGVVRALVEAGAIGMVTTHDLALAGSEGLGVEGLRSMHFQDEIVDGEMRFDFRLREGVAMRSNGVELMRLIGLKV